MAAKTLQFKYIEWYVWKSQIFPFAANGLKIDLLEKFL